MVINKIAFYVRHKVKLIIVHLFADIIFRMERLCPGDTADRLVHTSHPDRANHSLIDIYVTCHLICNLLMNFIFFILLIHQ